MDNIKHFSLPISGLKDGNHTFTFDLDEQFLAAFENNLIKNGHFNAKVDVEKSSNMLLLKTWIKGYMETNCDRCLADIKLPVESNNALLVKVGNPGDSDDEVLYVEEEVTSLNVAPVLYESLLVSIPLIKVYDCEMEKNRPCNMEVLNILKQIMIQKGDDEPENIFKDIIL